MSIVNEVGKVDYSFFRLRFFTHISNRIYRADTQGFAYVDYMIEQYGIDNIEIIPIRDSNSDNN